MSDKKIKKYWGFVMHFGYVESSYVSAIILHHTGYGFDTLKEALTDLAHNFLDDYMDEFRYGKQKPKMEDFLDYLRKQPEANASAGPLCFLSAHANAEKWWAWDNLSRVYPYLDKFWENTSEPMECILPMYLDPERINGETYKYILQPKYNYNYTLKLEDVEAFRAEVIEHQTPGKDDYSKRVCKLYKQADMFECVGKDKRQKKNNGD